MNERTYSEQEVVALIRRAAELQQRAAGEDRSRPFGRADIEAIARETGIAPEYVRQALAEPAAQPPRVETEGRRVSLEHVVPSTEPLDSVLAYVRHRFEYDGPAPAGRVTRRVIETPSSVEWRQRDLAGVELRVLLQAEGSHTRMHLSREAQAGCGTMAGVAGVPAMMGVVAWAMFGSGAAGVLVAVVTLGLAILAARHDARTVRQVGREQLEALARDLEERLRPPAPPGPEP